VAVRDAQTIDSIARASDGLLTLLITEDRPYTPDSAPAMAEELRSKLNAYIYALKTEQIEEREDREPAVVLLHTVEEPPQAILDVLKAAGHLLHPDGVTVAWQVADSLPTRDRTAVVREIAAGLVEVAPEDWTHLRYAALLVGERRRDRLTAVTPEGPVDLQGAPGAVRAAVEELKQLMWTPERGTWLELEFTADRAAGQLSPGFNYNLEPAGDPLAAEDYVEELRRFPRAVEPLPEWLAQRVAESG
jgi:hypothetical protein